MSTGKAGRYAPIRLAFMLSCMFFLVISMHNIASGFRGISKNNYTERIEINIKNKFIDQQNLMDYGDMLALKRYFSSGKVSYMNEIDAAAGYGATLLPVKVVLAGEDFELFSEAEMIRGAFLGRDQHRYGRKAAIISDRLAEKLFTTYDAIGNDIAIGEEKYKITGVYHSSRSLLSFMSSDGIERIYVPFESMQENNSLGIDTVFIKDKNLEEERFKENRTLNILREKTGADLTAYRITDFYTWCAFLEQPLQVFIFFMAMLVIFMLAVYFMKCIIFFSGYLRGCMQNKYFFEMLVTEKARIALFLAALSVISALMGLTLWLAGFKPLIPYQYIPYDNIFDLGFYLEKLIQYVHASNQLQGYIPTSLEMYRKNASLIINLLSVFLAAVFILTVFEIRLYKACIKSPGNLFLLLPVSGAASVAISFGACTACGFKYSLPLKSLAVVIAFLLFALKYGKDFNFTALTKLRAPV